MALRDIRDLKDDPEEYQRELERRWTGLLSYRYIGRNHGSMNTGPEDNTVTLRRDMRNLTGGLLVAPLSISSPEGNVGSDLETVPNPVIHSCVIVDPAPDVTTIEVVDAEVLHPGTRMGYSRSRIVDADDHDRVIAYLEGQGARIGTVPEGLDKMPEDPLVIVDSPDLPPLWQAFGASKRDDGTWQLGELSVELASPDAALHIGPQHVVLETAAMDAAAEVHVFDHFREATRDQMAILISHRFSTVRMADHIVVLQDGAVLEQGDHQSLTDRGGLYADLYALQARVYH
jgi:hypothetical protein